MCVILKANCMIILWILSKTETEPLTEIDKDACLPLSPPVMCPIVKCWVYYKKANVEECEKNNKLD